MPHSGMGTHQSSSMLSDEWLTPPHILTALGRFDLDPCGCSEPRPWPTADRHYTRQDNGLMRAWSGRVWLNPPYGGPSIVGPWMRRMADHRFGTALIFARTETDLFHETVWQRAAGILFLRGRLFFHRRDGGRAGANAGAPSCLVAYGSGDMEVLSSAGLPGRLVVL
jgi:DNA N-6-adenine-methyltransferase (Dam)